MVLERYYSENKVVVLHLKKCFKMQDQKCENIHIIQCL